MGHLGFGSDLCTSARRAWLRVLLVAIGSLALAGCADPLAAKSVRHSAGGLVEVRLSQGTGLWVKPDHHLGRYDDFLIRIESFGYAEGEERLERRQEAALRDMLEAAVLPLTQQGPVGRATRSGPCVLDLQVSLRELQLARLPTVASKSAYVSSFGSALMVIEVRDSTTNTLLLRYAAWRGLGGGQTGGSGPEIRRLGRAMGKIASDMFEDLETIVPDPTGEFDRECGNGVYKLTGNWPADWPAEMRGP